MRPVKRLFSRVLNFPTRRRGDERLREEIESHLAAQTEENISAGMTLEEARRQARLKFGSVEAVRADYHAEAGLPFLDSLLLDVRYALRVLRKSPGFTIVVLLTLMLGIGVNVVVCGVINAVLLHPLGVSDESSLYQIRHQQWMSGHALTTSYPAFDDFRQRNTTFSGMVGIYAYSRAELVWRNTELEVAGYEVTGNYFDVLGVQPEVGQFFRATDEHGPGSAPFVVLSDGLWRSAFNGDPGVVGTTVELNKHPFTVVGVAPKQFHGTEQFEWPNYWIPILNGVALGSDDLASRKGVAVTVIGRLKPGVTAQQATENLNAIAAELGKEYPESDDGQPLRLIHPGLQGDQGDVIRGFLYSVTALAVLVLLAACANLATLFAARATDRSRELALRAALGSSRQRLVKQLLTEAIVVSLMGGAAGLLTAYFLLGLLGQWYPDLGHLAVNADASVYLSGVALTLGSALLFGMAPARKAWKISPLQIIKGGPIDPMPLRRVALRDLLLGVQIAICTLLVTASLVALQGMVQALHAPMGFQPQGALLVEMDLRRAEQEGDLALEKQKEIIEAVRSIPGVTTVGAVSRTPMTGGLHGIPIFPPGTTEFKLKNSVLATYLFIMSPGYLDAAGTRLLRGRDFSWHDTTETPYVAIVNETFARKMWRETPAIGQHFIVFGRLTEVVGVAQDGKYHDLQEPPQPVVYLALSQDEDENATFVVRSLRTPAEMAAALEQALTSIEPNVPINVESWYHSLEYYVLFPARAATAALGVMGLLAAMLAVTGIFGMAAYSVSRRIKELGIRVALGARATHVLSAAVGRPMVLLGVGSAVGLLSGVVASRLLEQIVYQANPRDPVVVSGAVLTMVLLGVAASAVPALRALAVDPSKLMREE